MVSDCSLTVFERAFTQTNLYFTKREFSTCEFVLRKDHVSCFDNLFHSLIIGECREMAFPAYFFFADKRLVNHTIRSVQVRDMDVCELLCYHEPNCVSINFQNKANDAGKFQCELNNSTHQEHDGEFVKATGYFYHGAEVTITIII